MSFEELVSMLNRKFEPYTMNRFERMDLANLYNKYPEKMMMECIEIGMKQYLRYDADNHPDIVSIRVFLEKLRGILYYHTKPPAIREMSHIECVGWRRFRDWDIPSARRAMMEYERVRVAAGYSQEEIAEGLKNDGYRMLFCVRDWEEWQKEMEEKVIEFKTIIP